MLRGLGYVARDMIQEDVDIENQTGIEAGPIHYHNDGGGSGDERPNLASLIIPAGEEGILNSNASGEFQYHSLYASTMNHSDRLGDQQTWEDHIELQNSLWDAQQLLIVQAYLEFKAHGPPVDLNVDHFSINVMDFQSTGLKELFHPSGSWTANELLA
ncbi:hypothetical protein VNI00_017337 [Paramarasmius palmivorus]|uniref:Uncharacterized protein n=1 Tax=Paramarasmius palmivorus TaxID=297713 RepID=A0AAW0B6N2_9AGAR